jgi:carbon monoxide dehydrogenase subunit G
MLFLLFVIAAGAVIFLTGRRRQTVIEKSVSINAAPGAVFAILEDPESLPQMAPGLKSISDLRRSEERIGDSFTANYSVLGRTFPTRFVVTHYSKDSRINSRMEGLMAGRFDWILLERANGTDLSATVSYEMQGGMLARAADFLMMRHLNGKNLERLLANIRRKAEVG